MSCPVKERMKRVVLVGELFSWAPPMFLHHCLCRRTTCCGWGGGCSQQTSRVSSLVACDMPVFRPPAGVSQWVVGPATPVVC